MLAWHVLISPHFSWNHGRGGWLGPGGGEEQDEDEVKFIDTDEVKWRHARGMTQSPTGCMLPEVRQHAEEMGKMYEKETKSLWHYLFLSSSSFKQLIIEDPLRQHDDKNRMLRFLSYCSSMTDRRSMLDMRKSPVRYKKNKCLIWIMLTYFHSKEQLGLTHMECGWYGLTQDWWKFRTSYYICSCQVYNFAPHIWKFPFHVGLFEDAWFASVRQAHYLIHSFWINHHI